MLITEKTVYSIFVVVFGQLLLVANVQAQTLPERKYIQSIAGYQVPDVSLLDQDRNPVRLQQLLDSNKPVALNFIYTSCTTICHVLSAGFTQLQSHMQNQNQPILQVSISIDPGYDSTQVLLQYAERYRAHDDWVFLTGQQTDIVAVQKAFDAYRRDKMNHSPLTFVRRSVGQDWIRIEGFPTVAELVHELGAASRATN